MGHYNSLQPVVTLTVTPAVLCRGTQKRMGTRLSPHHEGNDWPLCSQSARSDLIHLWNHQKLKREAVHVAQGNIFGTMQFKELESTRSLRMQNILFLLEQNILKFSDSELCERNASCLLCIASADSLRRGRAVTANIEYWTGARSTA